MSIVPVDIERVHNIEVGLSILTTKVDSVVSGMEGLTEVIAKQNEIFRSHALLSQSYEDLRQDYTATKDDYYKKKEEDLEIKGKLTGIRLASVIFLTVVQALLVYIVSENIAIIKDNAVRISTLETVVGIKK